MSYSRDDEFQCKCGCGVDVSPLLIERLQVAEEHAGFRFQYNSAARCKKHNPKVGGSDTSSHLSTGEDGMAVDIAFGSEDQKQKILAGLKYAGFTRFGIDDKRHFIHTDIDSSKPAAVWSYGDTKNA